MKKQTIKQKVLKMLSEGMKPKYIAAKLKIKTQQVYAIKSEAKKKMQLPGQIVFLKDPTDLTTKILQGRIDSNRCIPSSVILNPPTEITKKSFFQRLKNFLGV